MPTNQARFKMNWIDQKTRDYPVGSHLDLSHGARQTCLVNYAAVRVGLHYLICEACGATAHVGAGGTGSVMLACKIGESFTFSHSVT